MKRNIGVLVVLFTLVTLVTVGCGGAPTTVNVDATVEARVQAANVESTVEARVQATLAANGQPSTPEASGAQPTAKKISDKDGMTLLYVPAGEFKMGAADSDSQATDMERPQHPVYLDAFWIDQTEVTNAMYTKCVKAGACQAPAQTKSFTRDSYYGNPQFDTYPVVNVAWNDAKQYCTWAGGNLPTEAQWEKAARGTDGRIYPWGNDAPDKTRLSYDQKVRDTTQVGDYPTGASLYGVLDMAGNVYEWVADWFGETYYASSADRNPAGSTSGDGRIVRGGSWYSVASRVRASYRNWSSPDYRDDDIGFRCAR
jgi:eukaryotic-like serine/threonine-protein kinase